MALKVLENISVKHWKLSRKIKDELEHYHSALWKFVLVCLVKAEDHHVGQDFQQG